MKVLVTRGCGFVGSNLAPRLPVAHLAELACHQSRQAHVREGCREPDGSLRQPALFRPSTSANGELVAASVGSEPVDAVMHFAYRAALPLESPRRR
jgi:nucleoside-diphosphate-sugar epimerase